MSAAAPMDRLARRRRARAYAAVGILLAWTLGVGMLVRREFFRERSAVLAEAAMRLAPGASYFVVEQGGRQVGFASTTIDTSMTTFEVVDYLISDLPAAEDARTTSRTSSRAVITLSRSLALRSFEVEFEAGAASSIVAGHTEGDSVVAFSVAVPGQPVDSQRLAVDGAVLLPALVPSVAMLTAEPRRGRAVAVRTFDPTTQTAIEVKLRLGADSLFTVVDSARFDSTSMMFVPALTDTVRAWRLEPEEGATGFNGWVDAQGRVIVATRPGGMTLRRMAYEIAFENWRRARGTAPNGAFEGTVIAAGALPSGRGPGAMLVRLSFDGASLGERNFDLDGGRQRLSLDTLAITRESGEVLTADWSLAGRTAGFRQRFAAELRAEPLLQVNDGAITALALRLAGSDRDPRVVAERINRWVHDSLEKVVTVDLPNATQVLRTRRGDAPGHAQLFTALARSVGIPTRIATGLVLVDGKSHFHVWPEIRLRDWVAVDPTFGQFPADAAHLRFVSGGITRQGELQRLVSDKKLRIEVLNAR